MISRRQIILLSEYNSLKKNLATVSDAESLEALQNQHYKALEADYLDLYKQADRLKAQVNSEKLDVEASLSSQIKEVNKKYSKAYKILEKERITILKAFIAKNS